MTGQGKLPQQGGFDFGQGQENPEIVIPPVSAEEAKRLKKIQEGITKSRKEYEAGRDEPRGPGWAGRN